jgi:hypothetical protein
MEVERWRSAIPSNGWPRSPAASDKRVSNAHSSNRVAESAPSSKRPYPLQSLAAVLKLCHNTRLNELVKRQPTLIISLSSCSSCDLITSWASGFIRSIRRCSSVTADHKSGCMQTDSGQPINEVKRIVRAEPAAVQFERTRGDVKMCHACGKCVSKPRR